MNFLLFSELHPEPEYGSYLPLLLSSALSSVCDLVERERGRLVPVIHSTSLDIAQFSENVT
jgi:hypothetical protein